MLICDVKDGLGCVAGELAAVPLARLEGVCGEADAQWLHRLARGIDDEEVAMHTPQASIRTLHMRHSSWQLACCTVALAAMFQDPVRHQYPFQSSKRSSFTCLSIYCAPSLWPMLRSRGSPCLARLKYKAIR